jgi:8-oxo-dGTP diphosphatase
MNGVPGRKTTEVAVGVLLRADRAVLLADRPEGKPYPGYWEFPGGKIEPGESVEHALARELHEELGVDIGRPAPWVTFEFDYPHAYVRLHFCRVYDWRGTPHGREGQRLDFFRLDGSLPQPLLPAAVPALRWLALPGQCAIASVDGREVGAVLAALDAQLARGARLVIVDPSAAAAGGALGPVLPAIVSRARAFGAPVMVGGGGAPAVDGRLLATNELAQLDARPAVDWLGARADARDDLGRAGRLGCDFVLVGPVLPVEGRPAAATIGWHGAAEMLRDAPLPVYLFGGLQRGDLVRAIAAGAHGIVLGDE